MRHILFGTCPVLNNSAVRMVKNYYILKFIFVSGYEK
jgi:hypothetical protein